MTDQQFAAWLRSLPREQSEEQVHRSGRQHDAEQGEWVANQIVHHEYGESAR